MKHKKEIVLSMKKYYLFVLTIISVSLMLVNCNGNGTGTVSADKNNGATEGTINGHDWVDLGLPSGTLWATCNVGANAPEENGDYFSWGETAAKEEYLLSTCKYFDYNNITKYCNDPGYGDNAFADNKTVLEPSDDAATANWGDGWCLPTKDEFKELIDKCTWMKKSNGFEVKGPNGKTILLPLPGYRVTEPREVGMNGYYWTSSLGEKNPSFAWKTDFTGKRMLEEGRYMGLPVRPVCKK